MSNRECVSGNQCGNCKNCQEMKDKRLAIESLPLCVTCRNSMNLFFRSGIHANGVGSKMGWIWKCTLRYKNWHKEIENLKRISYDCQDEKAIQNLHHLIEGIIETNIGEASVEPNQREVRLRVNPVFEYFDSDEKVTHNYPYCVWTPTPILGRNWIEDNITEDFRWSWVPAAAPRRALFKTLEDADKYAQQAVKSCMMSVWKTCSEPAQGIDTRCKCGRTYCKIHHLDLSELCSRCKDKEVDITLARVKYMRKQDYPLIN